MPHPAPTDEEILEHRLSRISRSSVRRVRYRHTGRRFAEHRPGRGYGAVSL